MMEVIQLIQVELPEKSGGEDLLTPLGLSASQDQHCSISSVQARFLRSGLDSFQTI